MIPIEKEEKLQLHAEDVLDQMVDTLAKLNLKVTCPRITEVK